MKLIYQNEQVGFSLYSQQDESRSAWVLRLTNPEKELVFEDLEPCLKTLTNYFLRRKLQKRTKSLDGLCAELGEVYSLIYKIAKSHFIGWENRSMEELGISTKKEQR